MDFKLGILDVDALPCPFCPFLTSRYSSSLLLICILPKACFWTGCPRTPCANFLFLTSTTPPFLLPHNSHLLMKSLRVERNSSILFNAFSSPFSYSLRALVTFQYLLQPTPYRIPSELLTAVILGSFQYLFSWLPPDQHLAVWIPFFHVLLFQVVNEIN